MILAELMLQLPGSEKERIKDILQEVAQSKDANIDLRARALMNLAQISVPAAGLQLVYKVQGMKGIASYIQSQARPIQKEIERKALTST